jgi:hypothetical protein
VFLEVKALLVEGQFQVQQNLLDLCTCALGEQLDRGFMCLKVEDLGLLLLEFKLWTCTQQTITQSVTKTSPNNL